MEKIDAREIAIYTELQNISNEGGDWPHKDELVSRVASLAGYREADLHRSLAKLLDKGKITEGVEGTLWFSSAPPDWIPKEIPKEICEKAPGVRYATPHAPPGGYSLIAELEDEEGMKWFLHKKYSEEDDPVIKEYNLDGRKWDNYILLSEGTVPYRSRYWLGWNGKRMALCRSNSIPLHNARYELHKQVIDALLFFG